MPQSATRVKCGSADIVLSARDMDRNQGLEYDLRVRVDTNPASLFEAWRRSRGFSLE